MTNPFMNHVDVLDFGADPTGKTDSTDAIKSAIDPHYEARKKAAMRIVQMKKNLDVLGVRVGSNITVTWEIDDAYGGYTASHMGKVTMLDDRWIKIEGSPNSPGHFECGLGGLSSVILENNDATNPFMNIQANPFIS